MAPPKRGCTHPITAHYSFIVPQKDERLSWPSWLTLLQTVYPHKWSPVSCRLSVGLGKFAGHRPTFHTTNQPTDRPTDQSLQRCLQPPSVLASKVLLN